MCELGEIRDKEFIIEWSIKDFLSIPVKVDEDYDSPIFSFANASWYLTIYPDGETKNKTEGFVGLFLVNKTSGPPIIMDYTVGIKTADGKLNYEKHLIRVFSGVQGHGMFKWIKKSEILEKKSDLLPSGALILVCRMKHMEPTDISSCSNTVSTKCSYCCKTLSNQEDIQSHLRECEDLPLKCRKCNDDIPLKNWYDHECQTLEAKGSSYSVTINCCFCHKALREEDIQPHLWECQEIPIRCGDLRMKSNDDVALKNWIDQRSQTLQVEVFKGNSSELEEDALIHLLDEEPEYWSETVDKEILKMLQEKDVKRQEAIYEFISTEKHHCLTLKIMQTVFVKGMLQELNVGGKMVQKIFPCLDDLIRIHMAFLQKLQERQRQETVVSHIADIILKQFQGQNAEELRTYYSQFCSQHKEALSLYKVISKSARNFQSFVEKCGTKPFCKNRGVPECILLVTQRITKYSLLIDAIIKTSKGNKQEVAQLNKALNNVKDIVTQINSAVAEKDRQATFLENYKRIDAKSTTFFKGQKFQKSDLLSNNRKLRYEGILEWKSAKGKIIEVYVIILSDIIVLLQENNQKYTFASLDNKDPVISLQKLLVREKAGQDSKSIYLISSNDMHPEMYELLSSPKDKTFWLQIIRDSVTMLTYEAIEKNY